MRSVRLSWNLAVFSCSWMSRWTDRLTCVSLKLVVEVDGPLHSKADDDARDAILRRRGFDVLRFSAQDMDLRFQSVLDTIHREVYLRSQQKIAAEAMVVEGDSA